LRREVFRPLAQELLSPKEPSELDSSSSSTGRIPRGKVAVELRVQREVQLPAVHRSDSPAWSAALALAAVALVLEAVLASKPKMSTTANASSSATTECSPQSTREVKSTSHQQRPPPGVQHSVPSFALVLGAALAGLQVESIRRTMSPRPAARRCFKMAGRGGCRSLQRDVLICLLGTDPRCGAS
jgi:hypothetical protein